MGMELALAGVSISRRRWPPFQARRERTHHGRNGRGKRLTQRTYCSTGERREKGKKDAVAQNCFAQIVSRKTTIHTNVSQHTLV